MKDRKHEDQDLEQKLHAYFRAETDDLAPTDDLWQRVEGRLGKQENPPWYIGRMSFRSFALRRVVGAIALMFAVSTVGFFILQMAPGFDTISTFLNGTDSGAETPSVGVPTTPTAVPSQGPEATATPMVR